MTKWNMWRSMFFGLVTVAGCGVAEPAPVETSVPTMPTIDETASPLTAAQIWTGSFGLFPSYTITCAGRTWWYPQVISQVIGPGSPYMTRWSAGAPLSGTRNELEFDCPTIAMTDIGTILASVAPITCGVYAHQAGQGWRPFGSVKVPTNGILYAPKGSLGHPAGYWVMSISQYIPLDPYDSNAGCFVTPTYAF